MLLRIACARCRLASLWTDEPRSFLATICREPRRCEAMLLDEEFRGTARPPCTRPAVSAAPPSAEHRSQLHP